jgi:modulator of FtsH protease HflC
MNRSQTLLPLIVLIILAVVGLSSIFTVEQTQQALVLRFGEPVAGRGIVTDSGLHFKMPFIEGVVHLDKRILDLESPQQEVLASDNQRLVVDAFLRYQIVDPLKFFQAVGTGAIADNQLSSILNSSVRRILGEVPVSDIIRAQRAELMVKIRDQVNFESARLGVAAIDVRIRRADLPKEISEKVFSRMQSERQREAAENRAKGNEEAQIITSKADRDVTVLIANAQQQADTTRGEGDAARASIFAAAYSKDPEFFGFYRSMQAYEAGLKAGSTRMVISPTSDFFRYFGNAKAQAAKN